MVSANSGGEAVTNQPNPLESAIAVLVAIDSLTDDDTSGPDLARPEDDPLAARQALEPARAACVQLVGRDADLRAEAVFESVGKARGRDHDHGARVDLAQEARR